MVIDYCNFFGYCILYLDYFKGILVIVSLKSMFDNLSKQQNNQQQENKPAHPVYDAPQQPVASKENVGQRIEKLREKGVKQGSRKKLYSIIGIAVILFFVGGAVGVGYFYWDDITNFLSSKDEGPVACAMDAKICPDGSSVGRVPPDCEFAECPCVVKEKVKCAKEGECINPPNLIGKTDYPDVCCEGFIGVGGYRVNENGECEVLIGNPYLWCIPCGNGICDKFESIEENKCNCPEDCGEEVINISNWQIYRNEEFKILFKHSAENLQETDKGIIFGELGNFESEERPYFQFRAMIKEKATIPSMPQGEKLTLENVLNRENYGGLMEEFQINSYNAVRFENFGICDGPEILVFTDEFVYDFIKECGGFEELNKIVDSIIFLKDIDNDGLFDDEEAQYGCDINNPDSDGDGYLDGDEVQNGYNPMGEGKLRSKK